MKRGLGANAYTVVEVMIVLAVTAAILASVMLSISGQQRHTEFSQAVNDINSQIQDIANDINTGYYAKTQNLSCSVDLSGPQPQFGVAGSDVQGQNQGCIFIGRVMQFGVAGSNRQQFNVYNVAGLRQVNSQDVTGLTQAAPRADPNTVQSQNLQYGLKVQRMYYDNGAGQQNIGAVGFISNVAPTGGGGVSGITSVNVFPITGSGLDQDQATAISAINGLTDSTPSNPSGGVVICFQSAGTNQYGLVTIASNGRALNTKLDVKDGTCP